MGFHRRGYTVRRILLAVMVLESLFTVEEAEKEPSNLFLLGIVISTVALWLSFYIFPQGASTWMLFIITLAVVPLMHKAFMIEEAKGIIPSRKLLRGHFPIIKMYIYLFLGIFVSLVFWYLFLPTHLLEIIFSVQMNVASTILSDGSILMMSLKVLGLFMLLTFLYGAGGILILAWDAALSSVIVGNLLKHIFLGTYSSGMLAILLPSLFEIIGYSLAAIAAGILSVAFYKGHLRGKFAKYILIDFAVLTLLALIMVSIGALVAQGVVV
tara:strand:+ start:1200 stop:2006 length:807 start_codon:yes stop_codon:yes gene_type:complete